MEVEGTAPLRKSMDPPVCGMKTLRDRERERERERATFMRLFVSWCRL